MGFGFSRASVNKRPASGVLTPAQSTLSVGFSAVTLTSQIGGAVAVAAISVENTGSGNSAGFQRGTITYDSGSGWRAGAVGNGVLQITADPALVGGSGGTFVGHVPVTDANASNSPQTVDVTFVVSAAPQPPVIALSSGTAAFTLSAGAAASSSTITVSNAGGDAFTTLALGSTTYGSGSGWLAKSLTGLTITITVDPVVLTDGNYTASFPVTDATASNTGILVTVNVAILATNPAVLVLTPGTRNFSAISGGSNPGTQTIAITNGGGATLAGPTAAGTVTYGAGSGWVTTRSMATVVAGSSYTLTVGLTTGALAAGVYTATFTVSDANCTASPTVSITFNVSAPVAVGNFPTPQFTLPSWLTHNGTTDVLSGEPFASPNLSTYFTGATHSCATLGQLTTALATCVDTDIISITADISVTSRQTLRNRGDAGWVLIRSSGYASLPAAGTRVNPTTHAAAVKALTSSSTHSILDCAQSARGYYFQGLKFTKAAGAGNSGAALVDLGAATQTTGAHVPTYLEFRHCVMTNPWTTTGPYSRRGIAIRSRYVKIRDCYIDGHVEPGTQSQAVTLTHTQGDLEIHNCFLEGSSENIIAGGSASSIGSAGTCSNVWIHQNYIFKRAAWLAGGSAPDSNRRHLLELKVGDGWVIEGNAFEGNDSPAPYGDINLGSKPQSVAETAWNYVRNILIRLNKFIGTTRPVQFISSASDVGNFVTNGTQRIQVAHNVWHGQISSVPSNWAGLEAQYGLPDITFEHNVWKTASMMFSLGPTLAQGGNNKIPNLIIRNNTNYGASTYGPVFQGGGAENLAALNNACGAGLWTCAGNVVLTRSWSTLAAAPYSNKTATTLAGIGFADSANGDYSLVAGSAYKNTGTDGADPGPNWSRFTAITAGVTTGTPTGS